MAATQAGRRFRRRNQENWLMANGVNLRKEWREYGAGPLFRAWHHGTQRGLRRDRRIHGVRGDDAADLVPRSSLSVETAISSSPEAPHKSVQLEL